MLWPVGRGGCGAIWLLGWYETATPHNGPPGGENPAAAFGVNWFLDPDVRLLVDDIHRTPHRDSGAIIRPDDGDTLTHLRC